MAPSLVNTLDAAITPNQTRLVSPEPNWQYDNFSKLAEIFLNYDNYQVFNVKKLCMTHKDPILY